MDDSRLVHVTDPLTAIALLTRLPVPGARFDRSARAAWAWPLVGLVVAGLAAIVMAAALAVGLPATIASGLAILSMIAATGAMHEDGLADTVDGFWGGHTKQDRLSIMRDSHIGTYGVVALIASIGLRWDALQTLAGAEMSTAGLIAAATLSRASMVPLATLLPHARGDGLSVATGHPGVTASGISLAIGLLVPAVLLGAMVVAAVVPAVLMAVAVAAVAWAKIGGQTGDVLGATQQVTEIAVLLGLCVILA